LAGVTIRNRGATNEGLMFLAGLLRGGETSEVFFLKEIESLRTGTLYKGKSISESWPKQEGGLADKRRRKKGEPGRNASKKKSGGKSRKYSFHG